MQSTSSDCVVILGTGGTIAGRAAQAADNVGYKAGEISVQDLIGAVPPLAQRRLEAEQVAQLDSKNMDHATWQHLARRLAHHLGRPEVRGVVITHGTDTLEETAYFLQRVLAPTKPVVMTAAMRPATALLVDGPQNLLDAVCVAEDVQASGVLVCVGGQVFGADQVQKSHSYRVDAFRARDGAVLAVVEEGHARWLSRAATARAALGLSAIERNAAQWPRVEMLFNHVGADAFVVQALLAAGVQGLVVAATGNGTLSERLEAALVAAQAQGVKVVRSTRCDGGPVVGEGAAGLPGSGALSPVKARVELLLQLLTQA